MALFETKVTFKTYELLCDMLELSNYNFNRFSGNHNYVSGHIYEHIPKFNTGRQTAKTSAVIEYAEKHPKERIIVVVHNQNMVQHYRNLLRDNQSSKVYMTLCSSHSNFLGIDYDTVIFDELEKEEVVWFLFKHSASITKNIKNKKMVAIVR